MGVEPGAFFAANGTVLNEAAVLDKAKAAKFILVGETHTSPCDHRVQASVIRLFAQAGINPVVGLEMADVANNEVLGRFNSGQIPVDDLPKALNWSKTWGHPFMLYSPIFQTIHDNGLEVFGLNVPAELARKVGREGLQALTETERALMPSQVIKPSAEAEQALREQFSSHKTMAVGGLGGFERFILVQSLWDTAMAENAVALTKRTGKAVIILAGVGHVERGWGIAHRLKIMFPEANVLSILPWRGEDCLDSRDADLFFFCPLGHRSRLGYELTEREGAVFVTKVESKSKAEQMGLQTGDRIKSAGGKTVKGLFDLHAAGFEAAKNKSPLRLTVVRQGQEIKLELNFTPDQEP